MISDGWNGGRPPAGPLSSCSPVDTDVLAGAVDERDLRLERFEPFVGVSGEHAVDEPVVMRVVGNDLDPKIETRRTNEPPKRLERRILATAFNPRNLGLRLACSLGEPTLREPRARSRLSYDRPRGHVPTISNTASDC